MSIRSFTSHLRNICHQHSRVARIRRFRWTDRIATVGIEHLEDRALLAATLSINDPSVIEGNSGSTNLNFTVTRGGDDLLSAVTVAYSTSDNSPAVGAATAGGDYTATSGTVTIPSGATTATISVAVQGDTTVEPNEQFFVNLTGITNVVGPAVTMAPRTDFTAGTGPVSVAIGDLNGDGKPDMAITNANSNSVSVLLNTTATGATMPSYAPKADFATGTNPFSVAIGDLNGDGKPDLAIANRGSNSVSVLLNTMAAGATTSSFAARTNFTTGSSPQSVAIGDLNGDGKPDLAIANLASNSVSVLLNTTTAGATTPSYALKTDFTTGSTPFSVAIGDLNGDGKPDLAVANWNSNSVSVLLNTTGAGAATPSYSGRTDFATGSTPISVAIGDINGDGKPDLATANWNSDSVSVLLNTTTPGAATPSYAARTDFTTGFRPEFVAIGDLNGDGKPDLSIANSNSSSLSVLRNTTVSGATTPSYAPKIDFTTGADPRSVAIGDLNGDGKPDLAIATVSSNTVSVLLNTTVLPAALVAVGPRTDFNTGEHPRSVAIGDLNGDGKPDLAIANRSSNSVSVFLNATTPGATTQSYILSTDFAVGMDPSSIAIGDLNGDGKRDLVVTNGGSSGTVSVLFNTTTGASTPTFAPTTNFTTGSGAYSVAIGDINGDGKPDLAVANYFSSTLSVLLNTTATGATIPSFAAKTDFTTGTAPRSVAIGDLNGDGKPDLAITNRGANSVAVLLNTAATGATTPNFAARVDFVTGTNPTSVAIRDLNGDGRGDLAIANWGSASVSVLRNTTVLGATVASFAARADFATGLRPYSVAIGDLNGDGKPDLATANRDSNSVSVLLNTTVPGATTLSYATMVEFTTGQSPFAVAIADMNLDGKLDLAVANYFSDSVSVLLSQAATIIKSQGIGTILNDDTPTVNLSVSANTGTEAGTTVITVTATASAAVSGNQTVTLGVSGTGVTSGDYSLSGSTITIQSGQTTGTQTFTVKDDLRDEGTEIATLIIANPSAGLSLGATTTQNISITDDDNAGTSNYKLPVAGAYRLVLNGSTLELFNSINTLVVDRPIGTDAIAIHGTNGSDTLTIDLSGGDAIPVGNLFFNGGNPTTNPGDALVITGGVQGNVTYNYTNASDGNVVMSNVGTIYYTGLEPITNTGTATNVIFNLPAGPNSVILGDDGFKNGLSRLSGATFEQTYFANPTSSLTINPGSTADTISVGSIPEFDATLNLGGFATPFQTIAFTGWLSLLSNNPLRAYATDGVGLSAEANLQLSGGNGFYSIDSDADANGVGTYSQASGSVVTAGTFAITAADIDLQGSLAATMNNSLLMPSTNDATIGVEGPGSFNLTDSELDLISIPASQGLQVQRTTMTGTISLATTAHVTQSTSIQFGTAGSIVTGPFDYTATQYLSLQADWDQDGIGAISTIGGLVTSPNLHLNSGAGITLNTNAGSASITNRISGDIAVTELDSITVFSDGVRTLGGNGSISISAGGSINGFSPFVAHGSGTVSLAANGSGASIGLNQVVSSTTGSINLSADDGVTLNSANSDITTAGILSINADGDSDGTGTFSSSNAGAAINSGSVSITAADIVMLGTINTGSGTTTLIPTNGRAIDLGTNTAGTFALTDAELDLITAATIQIGNAASGAITVTDNISQPAKNLKLVTGAGVSGTGSVINGSASTTSFTVQQTGNSIFAGIIGGPVGGTVNDKNLTLVKSGSGTLSLSAANTFTGITNVTQGTLEVTNEMSLGAAVGGTIVEAGATLNVTPTTPAAFSEPLTLNGTGLSNAGALRASGHAVWIGVIEIASASTIVQADLSFSIQGPVQNNSFDLTYDQNSLSGHAGTISGIISGGGGGFIKEGQGQLTFQAANTYEGITTINAGLLTTASNGTLGNTSQGTIVNIGGSLAVFTSSAEPLTLAGGDGFAGVYGSLLVDNNSNITGPVLLTGNSTISVLNDNSFATVAGVIQDAGNGYGITLNSFGSVTRNLILSGANTYTGTTTVNSGRLIVNGSLADSPAADDVVVKSAATLGGHGTIEGAVRIQNGGRMIPGFGPGILTTGAVIFDSGSNISVKTGGDTPGNSANNHDQLAATSSVTIGSNVTLNLSLWGSFVPVAGRSFTIVSRTGGTGNFAGLDEAAIIPNFLGSGLDAAITYQGGDGDDIVIFINTPPVLSIDDLNYTAGQNGGNPVQIDPLAMLSDPDGDGDWDGGFITVRITANAEVTDEISIPDNIVRNINTAGFDLRNGTTVFGTLSDLDGTITGSNVTLTIAFNSNATNALVQQVLRAISYRSTSATPSLDDRTVTFSAFDRFAEAASVLSTISIQQITELRGIDVQNGQTQRSYLQYVDVLFDQSNDLMDMINNGRFQLTKRDLDGNSPTVMPLPSLSLSGNNVRLNFGANGIGGNRNTNAGDGYYEIGVDMDGNGTFESKKYFHRLLGDVNGDRVVDNTDTSLVLNAFGTANPERDANGDGIVNAIDRILVLRSLNRKLKNSLFLDD